MNRKLWLSGLTVVLLLFSLTLAACGDDDESAQANLSIVFTTDPQNERDDLVLLKDDKGMFPPYNSTLVVRDQTIEQAGPDLEEVVTQVEKGLTGKVMSELNARVDLDKKTPKQVAKEYLQESGSIQAIRSNVANGDVTIVVGSKNFTEQKVLGEIFAQGLAAAGYDISTELNLGDEKTALKAIKSGTIDAYPEYTGTALGSFFGVASADIPTDPKAAFEQAKRGFAEEGLTALPPTPFTSSNEVGLTADTAEKLGVEKISDLQGKSEDLTLYGSPECRQRQDCLLGLQQVYGLKFKKFVPVDINLRHKVLEENQ